MVQELAGEREMRGGGAVVRNLRLFMGIAVLLSAGCIAVGITSSLNMKCKGYCSERDRFSGTKDYRADLCRFTNFPITKNQV